MEGKTLISETTRKNLMNSFWKLYKSNDISKITVSMICKCANYDRTTFYRYFLDISDLLSQLEDNIIDDIKISIKTKNVNVSKLSFDNFKKFHDKYGEYIVVFYEKSSKSFYLKFKNLIKDYLFNYLEMRVHDEEKKEFLYEFLFSSLLNAYGYWYKHKYIMSLESFSKLAYGMLVRGGNMIIENI